MKIGLISDTHVPSFGNEPPWQVAEAFSGVDMILHAGDIFTQSCLDWLGQIAPVVAVEFENGYDHGLPNVFEKQVIEVEGQTIAMMHRLSLPGMNSEPFPGRIARTYPPEKSLPNDLVRAFGRPVDILVFGHTHVAVLEEHQGVLCINPGSPNIPHQIMKLGTVAVLEVQSGRRSAELIDLAAIPARV